MRPFLLATLLLAVGNEIGQVEAWMQQAFYPALFVILAIASLGVPIPEDIPLIAAGVLLRTHPGIATWHTTMIVALAGIMVGDLVLYNLGHRWGNDVVNHRSVSWLVTPGRFARLVRQFHRFGAWFCFFGRFIVGIRAAMCLTAGATRFPYWRFLLADLAGALLSLPLFVFLGYWFAGMIPSLLKWLAEAQGSVFVLSMLTLVTLVVVYKLRKRRRAQRIAALRQAQRAALSVAPAGRLMPTSPPASRPEHVGHNGNTAGG